MQTKHDETQFLNPKGQTPIGTINAFAGGMNSAVELRRDGWLICDGRELTVNEHRELYEVIGDAWGQEKDTTFNLPDLRGGFLRGQDLGSGHDPDAATRTASMTGGNTGDRVGSFQTDSLRKHDHEINYPLFRSTYSWEKKDVGSNSPCNVSTDKMKNGWGVRVSSTGGYETRPSNVYVLYLIKARYGEVTV